MKKALLVLTILSSQISAAQKIGLEGFVRLPQIIDINLTKKSAFYSPVMSTGLTLRYQNAFADFGVFMDRSDLYGYYTYFGSSVHQRPLDEKWKLVTNWFGEVTLLPEQSEKKPIWTYTAGLSPVLVCPLSWSTFAIALTTGPAINAEGISLNARLILNCSIPLSK